MTDRKEALENLLAKIEAGPFVPDRDLQRMPEVKDGYVVSYGPVKFVPYKPQGQRQTKRLGRWKKMNEYGGWDNCETPAAIWQDDLIASLRALIAEEEA